MSKRKWVVFGAVAAACLVVGLVIWQIAKGSEKGSVSPEILQASEESGWFPDIVNGKSDAEVVLIEYGDYQCTACAPLNSYINDIVEDYDGKVAVVFRTMILPYHQNGTAAASAALAAYNQGYWKRYKDVLFENQSDWYYSNVSERQKQFEEYFMKASDSKGDLAKFREDIYSDEIAKKLEFDAGLSKDAGVEWTPYFMLDGQLISQKGMTRDEFIQKLREEIDKKLAN